MGADSEMVDRPEGAALAGAGAGAGRPRCLPAWIEHAGQGSSAGVLAGLVGTAVKPSCAKQTAKHSVPDACPPHLPISSSWESFSACISACRAAFPACISACRAALSSSSSVQRSSAWLRSICTWEQRTTHGASAQQRVVLT